MYLAIKETYKAPIQSVSQDVRNYELAELLLNGLGYEGAMKEAKEVLEEDASVADGEEKKVRFNAERHIMIKEAKKTRFLQLKL